MARFFIFLFLKGVESVKTLTANMYLISNGLEGWQVQMFFEFLSEYGINAGTTSSFF